MTTTVSEQWWTSNRPTPEVALAVAAHPDDIEFGAGGTLAKWAAAGCVVHHLVCTDGSKGTWDPDADTAALVTQRQVEQRAAADVLTGGTGGEVIFLGREDGELVDDLATRTEVVAAIRRLRPQVVLGHDPWKRYRLHPDHRAAGQLLCDAIVGARDPHFFRQLGLAHHRPEQLLLFEADEVNHVESIGGFVEAKVEALLAHESQLESTMHTTVDDELGLERFRQRIRARAAEDGATFGVPAAELFHAIDDL